MGSHCTPGILQGAMLQQDLISNVFYIILYDYEAYIKGYRAWAELQDGKIHYAVRS